MLGKIIASPFLFIANGLDREIEEKKIIVFKINGGRENNNPALTHDQLLFTNRERIIKLIVHNKHKKAGKSYKRHVQTKKTRGSD